MNWQETCTFFTACLPSAEGECLAAFEEGELTDIRLRAGQKTCFVGWEREVVCPAPMDEGTLSAIAEALTARSLYAREEEMRKGYVTLRGGHRMGVCGQVRVRSGNAEMLEHLSALCIRVAGQHRGCADGLMKHLVKNGHPVSFLLSGPPGSGKTTLLRDACRQLSQKGFQVCLADEKGELAACEMGVPQLDVGPRTDVLTGLGRREAVLWAVRNLRPDVILTDEIDTAGDMDAVRRASNSGVPVIATRHGEKILPDHFFAGQAMVRKGEIRL